MYVGIVAETNLKADPAPNAAGVPYPRHWVYVRKLWEANSRNPDPVTAHPIPVFTNMQHRDGSLTWEPLPVGTRVVVAKVDDVSRLNREQWAVIAYAPQTDAIFSDYRETVNYENRNGNVDKIVLAPSDPVTGPNEDYGRTHRDGDGLGWNTLRPYDDDPMRREMHWGGAGITFALDHKLDESVVKLTITVAGPQTYTATIDAVAQTATFADEKGNSMVMDSNSDSVTITTLGDTSISAAGNITLGTGEDMQPIARVGDTIEIDDVEGTTTVDGSPVSFTFTSGSGTISSGSGRVTAA